MTQLFQYRFGEDSGLDGHSFGNLYITAMAAITGSFESALAESGRVLAVRGRVIPSTLAEVNLCAEIARPQMASRRQAEAASAAGTPSVPSESWEKVCGESRIGESVGGSGGSIWNRRTCRRTRGDPGRAGRRSDRNRARQPVYQRPAQLVGAGPGQRPDCAARAPKVYVCNVATQPGETGEYDVGDHVRALREHIGPDVFQVVLANRNFSNIRPPGAGADWVRLPRPDTVDYQLGDQGPG